MNYYIDFLLYSREYPATSVNHITTFRIYLYLTTIEHKYLPCICVIVLSYGLLVIVAVLLMPMYNNYNKLF